VEEVEGRGGGAPGGAPGGGGEKKMKEEGAGDRLWSAMMSAVDDALCAAAPHIESALAAAAAVEGERVVRYSELLRFDFVVGRSSDSFEMSGGGVWKPWLIEVNASPNLEPSSEQQEAFLRRLVSDVADELVASVTGGDAYRLNYGQTARSEDDGGGSSGGGGDDDVAAHGGPRLQPPHALTCRSTTSSTTNAAAAMQIRLPGRSLAEHANVDCEVTEWAAWSACPCGTGSQYRTRSVDTYPHRSGQRCPDLMETRVCVGDPCSPPPR
jgi:hypothetical protein